MALIVVILVNYNSSLDTLEAVESVEGSRIPSGFERKVIVVENGSRDGQGEWEKLQGLRKFPDVELIRSEKNLGFTGGNNLGIERGMKWMADLGPQGGARGPQGSSRSEGSLAREAARAEGSYFLLLNADTKVDKNFLVQLVKAIEADKTVGIASPKIYFYPGFEFHKDRYTKNDLGRVIWYGGGRVDFDNVVGYHRGVDEVDSGQYDEPPVLEEEVATGCCMLIRREVIDKIGGFDDRYFFSWEDTDFSMRAKRAGFKLIFVPKAIIWHKNANTSGGAGSLIQDFYQTRNRLIFAFRYAAWKVKILLLWTLLQTANWNRFKAIFSALGSLG